MLRLLIAALVIAPALQEPTEPKPPPVPRADIAAGGRLAGLEFTDKELELMEPSVASSAASLVKLRTSPLPNDLEPAFVFDPFMGGAITRRAPRLELEPVDSPKSARPAHIEDLAFASIPELSALVKARLVTCVELVDLALARLALVDPQLHCVVNLTAERARKQAALLDRELKDGHWRGPLHGIPFGAKDLFAARGAPTTWGSPIYKDQVIDDDAVVIARLEDAGAILVAKLSCGELAMGDLWYGGRTRNPWSPEEGSSGSSAGSAAAVVAGAVPFALGTETLGSVVSPSNVCGASGLRPTFGRVSRRGAMALSWTMDKVGVLARSALDAGIAFAAIEGPSTRDAGPRAAKFQAGRARDVKSMRIGVPKGVFEKRNQRDAHVLDELREMGCTLVDVELPKSFDAGDLLAILTCEAASAFDEITRDGRDDKMVAQDADAWPNIFRTAQVVSAVDYLRASRLRTRLAHEMDALMGQVDVLVHPTWGSSALVITNLTGHPAVAIPDGFDDKGKPFGITFDGQLDGEQDLVALASAWQEKTGYHRRHPKL